MIGELLDGAMEFGVVLAGEKGIVNTGCMARIEQVLKRYEDGRMDILAAGRRRFELVKLDEAKVYLRAVVKYFDDREEAAPPEEDLVERAIRGYYSLKSLDDSGALPEPRLNDPHLSFQLAQAILDLDFRQTLLTLRSEAERIRQLAEFMPNYVAKQRRITRFRQAVPGNGRGRLDWNS